MIELNESIERLEQWAKLRSYQWTDLFATDLNNVLDAAKQMASATQRGDQQCACHERDLSYVCDYCKAQGLMGHMQGASQ